MTFIGWIKAQADVEFHRLEDFHFIMGAQEVNQGMDLGQDMMRDDRGRGNPGSKIDLLMKNNPLVLRAQRVSEVWPPCARARLQCWI